MSLKKESVAVITGAGSGIGRALALRLARENIAGLALADINEESLDETKSQLHDFKGLVTTAGLNVADNNKVKAFADAVADDHGRATHLINNAGVALIGNVNELSIENIEWLMNINFWGTVYGVKAFLPILAQQESAHIVNLSSIFGIIAPAGQAAYCASKFAVRGFTESLRHELEGTSISVSCVHPGGVKTNICNDSRVGDEATDDDKKKVVKFFNRASPTTADRAAEKIVNGIKRRRPRIIVGPDARRIERIQRLFPAGYFAVMNRLSGGALSAMRKR
jgi:NADP-dependent 3-hydroxy acid dehydrogenase YdfG